MARISNIGGGGSGGSSSSYDPATIVIAPVGYTHKADYYTDGVNDNIQIISGLTDLANRGGGVLELKAGNYYLGGIVPFAVPSNGTVRGEGMGITVIHSHKNSGHESFGLLGATGAADKGQNITLRDFTWMEDATDIGGSLCDIEGCNDVTVRNIFVNGMNGYGSYFWNCTRVLVENCKFYSYKVASTPNLTWAFVQFKGVRDGIVRDCYFNGRKNAGVENHNPGGKFNRSCGSVQILNCTFEGDMDYAAHLVESADTGSEIGGCTFRNCNNSISVGNVEGIRVHHNAIYGPGTTLYAARGIGISPGVAIKDCIVDHNVIVGITGNAGSGAMYIRDVNTISSYKISNNIMKNNNSGLFVRASSALIGGNSFYDTQDIPTQTFGIKVDGGVSDLKIVDNYFYNQSQQGIWLYNANHNTIIDGNRFINNPTAIKLGAQLANNGSFKNNYFSGNTTLLSGSFGSNWEIGHNIGY